MSRETLHLIYDISLIGAQIQYQQWQTGLFRYTAELLNGLEKHSVVSLLYAHTAYPDFFHDSKRYLAERNNDALLCNKPAHILPKNFMGRGERFFTKLYTYLNIDINRLDYIPEKYSKANIYHSPFNAIPSEIKRFANLRKVITIHDLIPLLMSNHADKQTMEKIIASIDSGYAICVSNNTRSDLLNIKTQINPDHVFVSHLAADPEKFYPNNNKSEFEIIKKRYELPDQYFLSLCTLEPRKNLDHLIRCFIKFVKQQHNKDIYLVLAGSKGWAFEKIFDAADRSGQYRNQIIFTGRIEDEHLAVVYSNANSFYFMSLYEGFGLPPLEAMQCGVPTVTSNVSSLPEVIGDGGIMLSPSDEDGLCQVMHELCSNSDMNAKYQRKALKQAKKFSWDKCVDDHIQIYHQIK